MSDLIERQTDLTELNKLEEYLKEHNIPYDRIDKEERFEETPHGKYIVKYEQHQIIVPPQDKVRQWDAICHRGSYGHESGLLEVMGKVARTKDGVEGWLTADTIIDRLECANCGEEPKKCDTCKHEREPWSMQCHRCENFNLWEGKDETGRSTTED